MSEQVSESVTGWESESVREERSKRASEYMSKWVRKQKQGCRRDLSWTAQGLNFQEQWPGALHLHSDCTADARAGISIGQEKGTWICNCLQPFLIHGKDPHFFYGTISILYPPDESAGQMQ